MISRPSMDVKKKPGTGPGFGPVSHPYFPLAPTTNALANS
ncbi:hypothetical protein ADIS_4653 [Lunatimonas lonarensis]|uniref:Uncharacterized protein n=1 Tax=Lunatimonas lonarensis TaxID=1232681 RepID=R7ZLP5_9BACT|nr:hypothetical protein ADIS_4653 [Lunatimonas lonarensis]